MCCNVQKMSTFFSLVKFVALWKSAALGTRLCYLCRNPALKTNFCFWKILEKTWNFENCEMKRKNRSLQKHICFQFIVGCTKPSSTDFPHSNNSGFPRRPSLTTFGFDPVKYFCSYNTGWTLGVIIGNRKIMRLFIEKITANYKTVTALTYF